MRFRSDLDSKFIHFSIIFEEAFRMDIGMGRAFKAYRSQGPTLVHLGWALSIVAGLLLIVRMISGGGGSVGQTGSASAYLSFAKEEGTIRALTWNIAAINNNPFEYWITSDDPSYNTLMSKVSHFIESPAEGDVPISSVFSDAMYNELEEHMKAAGWTGLAETRAVWENDFRKRSIISGFIKDDKLGKKRLASMPDRVTNSITTTNEGVVNRSVE